MLIISSKGLPNIEHETPTGNVTFGPVFNSTFMLEVFELQKQILGKIFQVAAFSDVIWLVFLDSYAYGWILYPLSNNSFKFFKILFCVSPAIRKNSSEDGGKGVGIEDICFAPLSSPFSGPVTPSQCAVMTPWGWFQNDEDNFDPDSYLDTILSCTKLVYFKI